MSDQYYYANGEQVALETDQEWYAIQDQRLDASALLPELREEIEHKAQPLQRGLKLIRKADMSCNVREELEGKCLAEPVYRADNALLAVLPEIRVEESRPEQRAKVEDWLNSLGDRVNVEQEKSGRLTITPRSGLGSDALDISNTLIEYLRPQLSQPRFLRVTSRMTSPK